MLPGFDRRVLERQEEEEREREERLREKRDRRVSGSQDLVRFCVLSLRDIAIVCHTTCKAHEHVVLQKAKAASDDEEEEFDPEMAAAMGFGGFGSSKQ